MLKDDPLMESIVLILPEINLENVVSRYKCCNVLYNSAGAHSCSCQLSYSEFQDS